MQIVTYSSEMRITADRSNELKPLFSSDGKSVTLNFQSRALFTLRPLWDLP